MKPYPKTKPSGVEWLGEVPEHWEVKRMRRILGESLRYGANEPAELDDPELPRYVRITDVHEDGTLRPETFRSLPKDVAAPYLLEDGDLLFARSGATSGKTFLYQRSWGVCAYAGYLIRARMDQRQAVPAFIKYYTSSAGYWQWLSSIFIQATIQNVSAEKYADLQLPLPTVPEQTAIAAYLDRETGRIDELVGKKRDLIERLKEKRTALISRTVTRGLPADLPPATLSKLEALAGQKLPPNPPLKPSGIDWLGEVPEHWDVHPVFRVTTSIQTGPFGSQLHAADYVEGGVPLINPAHIVAGRLQPDELSAVDEATVKRLCRHMLKEDDIVMARRGEIGRCAVVRQSESGWLCGTGSLVIKFHQACADYYWRIISGAGFSSLLELNAVGTTMLNLNPTIVGRMLLPVPPLPEQRAIAAYLDEETAKLDALVAKVETAIERLQEYRTALITAAVTGKIDVRNDEFAQ